MDRCVEEALDRIEYLLSRCVSSMLERSSGVAVRIKWLEELGRPVKGEVSAGSDTVTVYVNLAAVESPRDLLRTLAHEATHVLQRMEYGRGYEDAYGRYAYAYNPFEAQADTVAEEYAEDNGSVIEELIGPIYGRMRDLAYMLSRVERGFTYARIGAGEACAQVNDYLEAYWSQLLDACSALPPLRGYYERYIGPGRRRSPMASLIIGLGRRRGDDAAYEEPRLATPGLEDVAGALVEKLLTMLDGCRSTYCVLMKLDTVVDKAEDLSRSFGHDLDAILEKVLSDERVAEKIRNTGFSIGEAEYLAYNTPYFPKVRSRPHVLSIVEKALASRTGEKPATPGTRDTGAGGEGSDYELLNILDRIAKKIFLHKPGRRRSGRD